MHSNMKNLKTCLVILCLLSFRMVGMPQFCGANSFMKEIKLTKGFITLVDDNDYDFLMKWTWYASENGNCIYAKRSGKYMHRLLSGAKKNQFCDHKDLNTLNNQKDNLRVCTRSENNRNKNKKKNGKHKYMGVFLSSRNRSGAQITHNGKHIHIGIYKTIEEAALAYNEVKVKLHGEFSNLNIIV